MIVRESNCVELNLLKNNNGVIDFEEYPILITTLIENPFNIREQAIVVLDKKVETSLNCQEYIYRYLYNLKWLNIKDNCEYGLVRNNEFKKFYKDDNENIKLVLRLEEYSIPKFTRKILG